MSMNNPKYSRTNATALLQEAQIAVGDTIETQGGKLHELDPAQWCGRRALVFDEKEKGITVAIRIEISEMSPLRNLPVTSSEALTLLGALTFSLQARDSDAKLIGGNSGLEAIIVSSRLCQREIDPATLSGHLNRVQDIVQLIEPALSLSGKALIDSVLERVRPQMSGPAKEALKEEPVIVPTFDEEARDRMMQQMK